MPLNARIGEVDGLDHHVAQHEDLVVEVAVGQDERVTPRRVPDHAGGAQTASELEGEHETSVP